MNRAALLGLALLLAGPVRGDERGCYVLWQAQCFEIHDAESRDVTQHIFMTDGPVRLASPTDGCQDKTALLASQRRKELRAAFNERIRSIDACEPVNKLRRHTGHSARPLVDRFRRLTDGGEHQRIHLLEPPEPGS